MPDPFSKTSFTPDDARLKKITCGLCGTPCRVVEYRRHPYGEFVIYQCDECGALGDLCTNIEHMRWETTTVKEVCFPSLKKCLEVQWAESNPGKIEQQEAEEAKSKKKECIECGEDFTPRKSCEAVRDYCTSCRKEIPEDDDRWLTDKQLETKTKKETKKPKKVKRKVA